MAQALTVFQRNAEEKARLEGEQRGQAEAEARRMTAQRDSEAAISREIADFCGAMGDGDFSRRIDLAGKEGVFRDLSQQLNTLADTMRSEEHTSELQSLMRISYAVFCLKKKKKNESIHNHKDEKNKHTCKYITRAHR